MKRKYEGVSDEELIDRYREGEADVADFLINKYKNMVRQRARDLFILGGDNDDLIQEGMIGLFKAVQDYDSGRDASFHTFAQLCVSRQIYTAVQASGRQKHAPLNSYISLYRQQSDEENSLLLDSLAEESAIGMSPEEVLIDKETESRMISMLESELSDFEKQVLDLCLAGIGYVEIARILGREAKATDNAIQRIKTKMKKISKMVREE